eukprot:4321977-Pyramimonas_sp.AAC.1
MAARAGGPSPPALRVRCKRGRGGRAEVAPGPRASVRPPPIPPTARATLQRGPWAPWPTLQ